MKAIVVRQPWASLIALGIKTIETRPGPPNGPMRPDGVRGLPGCSLEAGERIAIVAGASAPPRGMKWIGPYMLGRWCEGIAQHVGGDEEECGCPDPEDGLWADACARLNEWRPAILKDEGAHGSSLLTLTPLGALIGTAVVSAALPMELCPPYGGDCPDIPDDVIFLGGLDGGPWMFIDGGGPYPLLKERALGDFTPGRWGWLLADMKPCDPVPCKGRQGVFMLPDDVAAAVPS